MGAAALPALRVRQAATDLTQQPDMLLAVQAAVVAVKAQARQAQGVMAATLVAVVVAARAHAALLIPALAVTVAMVTFEW